MAVLDKDASKVTEVPEEAKTTVGGTEEVKTNDEIIYFKATRGLTVEEHEALSKKLSFEEKKSGVKIVLIPFLLDVVDGEA